MVLVVYLVINTIKLLTITNSVTCLLINAYEVLLPYAKKKASLLGNEKNRLFNCLFNFPKMFITLNYFIQRLSPEFRFQP